ncbi:hypothetical protein MLD38_018032 [Melastoma candidum]|uniref:Uncharacterized protein n=1 Tax=Melastoma candidum TaxID=119954 RepID=A0ACB9R0T0_9MYRT|nr:hypothetical protein MLD38_018032 [Melastoma candidum]
MLGPDCCSNSPSLNPTSSVSQMEVGGFKAYVSCSLNSKQAVLVVSDVYAKVVKLSKPGLIRAAVLLQPSFITVDDIKRVKVPIAILGAEIDRLSPPELLKQFDEALAAKPEIFTKVSHGRTVRYKVKDELVVKAAEEAPKNAIEWFSKCLKSWNRVPTSL